ncbi:hypothetical protein D6D02_00177 [Aureobasidium pullulans]|uniref:Zinc finger PHD-type domain-containing protein n=1 Tax=Aureobasidium pullulans TaxID=5580 RepID=A0A4S8U643_AURPU|nr:hypothetical protein D6D26_08295 [Aureobasidium pullulans]THW22449.1 hypothetical protein D6D24_01125 [Aureobasidium pullulans]THY06546.1 hypothetical protein D6D03_02238 [Aureobasidium pullulans]THY25356.1 hypothetical protein D6D02_00177 [Aureobasidium pullulans]THY63257.1 hypothetical protein D6C98_01215 [Aureobasidium pullulans]
MSQFEARGSSMNWDWQQFTPSSTPTTTVFDINVHDHNNNTNPAHNANANANASAATPTQTHFHDAVPTYDHVYQKRDSIASTATSADSTTQSYVAYPQQLNQHQHHHQHAQHAYQPYEYATSPVFAHGQEQGQSQSQSQSQVFQMHTPPPTRGSSIKRRPQRLDNSVSDPSSLRQPEFNAAAFSFTVPQQSFDSWSQPSGTASAPLSAPAWTANADDPFSHWSAQSSQSARFSALPQSSQCAPPQSSAPSRPVITRSTSSNNVPYATPTTIKKPSVTSSVQPTHLYSSPVSTHFPSIPQVRPVSPEKPCLAPAFPLTSGPASPIKTGGLQRSNTVGNFLKPSPNLGSNNPDTAASLARSNSVCNLSRRSSPLKRIARGSLSSIAETLRPQLRTSVVLTIDANGTARTETRVIEESPTQPRKDTQSIKDKYPNLWDDSDSDSDTVSANKWPNRHDSLAQSNAGQERSAKMARLDKSSENLEMAQLHRSNSTASLKTPCKAAYAAAIQLRRQGSAKKQQRPSSVQSRRNTLSSLNSSFENLAAMDLNKDDMHTQTDAGSALRQAAVNRVSPPVQVNRAVRSDTMPSTVSRPRQMSQPQRPHQLQQVHQLQQTHQPPEPQLSAQAQQIQQPRPQRPQHMQHVQQIQTQQLPPNNQGYTHTHAKSHSVSYPTATSTAPVFDPRGSFTMDYTPVSFAPPAQQQQQQFTNDMSAMTRCICQIPFDDGRMIQCNLCAMYSHSGCVGLDPSQHAYVCSFCVSANPMQYGHQVRSSSMQSFNAWTVPGR